MHIVVKLTNAAQNYAEHYARVHDVTIEEAAALLVVSGGRRLHTLRRYRVSPKGEAAQARYEQRKARGQVKRRYKRARRSSARV